MAGSVEVTRSRRQGRQQGGCYNNQETAGVWGTWSCDWRRFKTFEIIFREKGAPWVGISQPWEESILQPPQLHHHHGTTPCGAPCASGA